MEQEEKHSSGATVEACTVWATLAAEEMEINERGLGCFLEKEARCLLPKGFDAPKVSSKRLTHLRFLELKN